MNTEERLARLERQYAQVQARNDLLMIVMTNLLAGELNEATLSTRLESLIANALNAGAPDATIDVLEKDGAALHGALASLVQKRGENPPRSDQPPAR